jgi:malate synthase
MQQRQKSARSQVWQWIRSAKGNLEDGRKVTADMVRAMILKNWRR